jgi:Metallo-peptidase family M12B Reprolysin-like
VIRLMTLASPLVLAADLLVAAAPASQAVDDDTETITIHVSDSTVVLGKRATVRGVGPSLRVLVLQMATAENGWQALDEVRTGTDGTYSFKAPGWYGAHRLRVVAPPVLILGPERSPVRTVTVKMGYRPRGQRSDWTWLGFSGARWEPCRRITYRINKAGGYDGSASDIRAAVRSASRITGLSVKYLGTTRSAVARDRRGYHPSGTDIVLDWQTPRQDRGLAGGVAGIGGHWVQDKRRFDGYVVLDRTTRIGRRTWRQIIEHEIGHVLGLSHARTASQVMFGTASQKNPRWGAGDLAGLRRIGASQGCLPANAQRPGRPERVDSQHAP